MRTIDSYADYIIEHFPNTPDDYYIEIIENS